MRSATGGGDATAMIERRPDEIVARFRCMERGMEGGRNVFQLAAVHAHPHVQTRQMSANGSVSNWMICAFRFAVSGSIAASRNKAGSGLYDSPPEGTGFEPSVPLCKRLCWTLSNRRRRHEERRHLQVQVPDGDDTGRLDCHGDRTPMRSSGLKTAAFPLRGFPFAKARPMRRRPRGVRRWSGR
jgi:hypothetical protein